MAFSSSKLSHRTSVIFSSATTFVGGLIRCFSTFPLYNDDLDKNTQFWIAVAAQAITGMGNPIAVSLPTKVNIICLSHVNSF